MQVREPAEAGFLLDHGDAEIVAIATEAHRNAEALEAHAGSEARWRMADSYTVLSDRGWQGKAIAEACEVSTAHVSLYLKCARIYPGKSPRPLFQPAYREAQGSVHFSSDTPEWSTPQELFDLLDSEFGFELDVCATRGNAKCERYFTEGDNGLAQEWTGACWMNPPYGRAIGEWMAKAHASGDAGATVVCLVPARTDTDWWWDHARHGEVRFLHGRLKFGDAESGAPFPSALVIFGRTPTVKWWEAWPKV